MKRTQSPGSTLEADVRERLLDVATELFARKGYAASTTREIVAAAEVTKPVLYYYFKSKEGIYIELLERAFQRFEAIVDRSVAAKGSIEQRLMHLCDQVFALIVEEIEVVRLMYSIYYGPPQGSPYFDFDAVHRKLFEALKQVVVEGIQSKELRNANPEDMTWAILGAIHVTMENELSHPERELGHEGLKRILSLIFQGLSLSRGKGRRGEKR